jgi:hypothetical protein
MLHGRRHRDRSSLRVLSKWAHGTLLAFSLVMANARNAAADKHERTNNKATVVTFSDLVNQHDLQDAIDSQLGHFDQQNPLTVWVGAHCPDWSVNEKDAADDIVFIQRNYHEALQSKSIHIIEGLPTGRPTLGRHVLFCCNSETWWSTHR